MKKKSKHFHNYTTDAYEYSKEDILSVDKEYPEENYNDCLAQYGLDQTKFGVSIDRFDQDRYIDSEALNDYHDQKVKVSDLNIKNVIEQGKKAKIRKFIKEEPALSNYVSFSNPPKMTQEQIAASIVSELIKKYHFGIYEQQLMLYKKKHGYFKPLLISGCGKDSLTGLILNSIDKTLAPNGLRNNIIDKVATLLLYKKGLAEPLQKQYPYIVTLRNGSYDLKLKILRETSPSFRSLYYINAKHCNYEMSEKSRDFLFHLAGNTDQGFTALMQIIGLAISNIRFTQSAGFLIGPPASGKSVLMEFLRCILSSGSVKTFEFGSLLKKTDRSSIIGAQIAICSDMETNLIPAKAVAIFKQLTSGERISVRKYYHNAIDFLPNAFIILCGNSTPKIEDSSGSFERRLITVYTGNTIPESERDPYIIDQLWDDRDAIVSRALDYASDIFNQRSRIERIPINLFNSTEDPNQAILNWADRRLEESKVPILMSNLYADYCKHSDVHLELNGFSQRFQKMFPNLKKTRKNNKSLCFGVNLAKSDSEGSTEDIFPENK